MTIVKDLNLIKFVKDFSILVVIISISFSLAYIINSYIAYRLFDIPEKTITKQISQEERTKTYQYITYLFKKLSAPSVQTPTLENENLPPSPTSTNIQTTTEESRNIKLIGTVLGEGEKLALLEIDGNLRLVKEREKVDNLRVKKIDRFIVVLTDGKKEYKIALELNPKRTIPRREPPKVVSTKPVTTTQKTENFYEISKREVEKHTADLGKLLKYVRIVPVVKNGETKGYKFIYVSPRSVLYKYGLRSGDFIISVNGMSVKTAEEAFKVYNILRNEKTINLEIERKGERKTITYQIK
ncbi:MAG: PDZ domain-containing protein [Aquificae bacterium]|nr:PDZ domain-containing protein [Aquificota bacterium]